MARTKKQSPAPTKTRERSSSKEKSFHLEFKNVAQKMAWTTFQEHDIMFLMGPAGVGKSYLATAFAINEILAKRKTRIVITRPIVEAGESLGYLPGTFDEKVYPYMLPIYDCIQKLVGKDGYQREMINDALEVAPLAYMRGRAQPFSAKILTPNGITTMGEIHIGDEVIGSNGQPTKVLGVYPQGFKDTYKVTFSDGSTAECCGEHLWSTQTLSEKRHEKGFSVKDTLKIKETLKNKHNQKNHRIPVISEPVKFAPQEVSVHPYLLGLLIGDGCFHKSAGIKFTTADEELVGKIGQILNDSDFLEVSIKHRKGYDYTISKDVKFGKLRNPLKSAILEMGLMGKKSFEKFIPDAYLYNDVETRMLMLRGLMDTDGTVAKHRSGKSRAQFSTTSEQLADNVVFLVQSLGGIAIKRERIHGDDDGHLQDGKLIRHARNSFTVEIALPKGMNPFWLARKRDAFTQSPNLVRLISSIEPVGRRMCQCIRVAADDHLYLTEGCVLTHNTFDDAICIFDEAQNATYSQLKLFVTRLGENSKMIITGDPHQSDLPTHQQGFCEFCDRIVDVEGVGMVSFKNDSIVRHPILSKILERL